MVAISNLLMISTRYKHQMKNDFYEHFTFFVQVPTISKNTPYALRNCVKIVASQYYFFKHLSEESK